MPLYSSLYQNLFRQGVAKSLTHGYAQSLVAATHPHVLNSQNRPSFARRNSQRAGPISAFQLHGAFHTTAPNNVTLPQERHHDKSIVQGGLDGYFEALQKHQISEDAEREWSFQFQKSIEWKPQAATILGPDATAAATEEIAAIQAAQEQEIAQRPVPVDAEAALAHIDAALSKELEARELQEELEERLSSRAPSPTLETSRLPSRPATPALESATAPASVPRSATPVDPQSRTYADHLTRLSEDGRHAEIPVVFETMLIAGVTPIAAAYNALLLAAIKIPIERTQVVGKVLDVYADMKRREIRPDAETYNILVGLLAERSLEVLATKVSFELRRSRYGGMEEPGQFMLASTELDFAIVSEDERLDLAMKLFDSSVLARKTNYSSKTYHQLITACAQAGRVPDMLRLFDHMELSDVVPFAATFPAMINAFAKTGDLASAVECYNEYKELAVSHDNGKYSLNDRLDAHVYAAVVRAYIVNDRLDGAMRFFEKVVASHGEASQTLQDDVISGGFVRGFLDRGVHHEALEWAQALECDGRSACMSELATAAADAEDKMTAVAAFANIPSGVPAIVKPAMALLAMSIRQGDVSAATRYWDVLSSADIAVDTTFIEPTAMYAVALIGSGQVEEGLGESEIMLQRIRETDVKTIDEIEEAVDFIASFMSARNIHDPREIASSATFVPQTFTASSYSSTQTASSSEDNFDPYAHSTDFKGSSLISDELEGANGRGGPNLGEALTRFRNMRRAGRHPRYITYGKLITAAAREGRMETCHDILSMARTDIPLLPQYAVVRYGWSSILDAMVGACLTLGDRKLAEQYHRELLEFGAAPSANTFGLYITTLKESTKTFDEASEAVKIFHRAKAEGIEPSSFLYNALIGKLGKARRIDDCLFYFAEMRSSGIKPTSVTYGTIVNALCRVSDDKFAEELFDEMEAMPNYKARPAPYNSMMQFFLTTKRDKSKVLSYYERMITRGIAPTAHTYKLLVDTHAILEPVNMTAAEAVLDMIRASGQRPEPVHYSSLIHARGCVLHDLEGARKVFDSVMADSTIPSSPCLFQAIFEAMVANHCVSDTERVLTQMRQRRVELTAYIANTLIHGWTGAQDIEKAKSIYDSIGLGRREPSTYEAMTRAFLSVEDRQGAQAVVSEMLSRGYPNAVVNKVLELLGGGNSSGATAV